MHLSSGGLDCPNTISANNSRPIMAACLQADLSNMHVPKRCGRPKPVADVSVRLVLVAESVEVSSREQEKTLFALKYRFLEWQKVTLAVFVAKKRPKTVKTGPCGPVLEKKVPRP